MKTHMQKTFLISMFREKIVLLGDFNARIANNQSIQLGREEGEDKKTLRLEENEDQL